MFGLNKNKEDKDKGKKPLFQFPLEKEIKDIKVAEKMSKQIEAQIHEIKKTIQTGAKPEEYEQLGTLLHGYSALLKILNADSKLNK